MRCAPGIVIAFLLLASAHARAQEHPWRPSSSSTPLAETIPPPPGFTRISAPDGSFAAWLRGLPLRPGRPPVRLFNGRPKSNQRAHFAVLDVDVGTRDLQQCADAVIRLRAEYLRAAGCGDAVVFDFTSGDPAAWRDWRSGRRPRVDGHRVSWVATASPDSSYASFRRYLESVFTYAGSYSLSRELVPVADPALVAPGDVFIEGGFPGHAVLVVDAASAANGSRVFLLAQSFMPAQDVHVLVNPDSRLSPWYRAASSGELRTPEWRFDFAHLKRFSPVDCELSRP